MSDLNDFFAKKDRKKKRAAAKSALAAASQEVKPVEREVDSDRAVAAPPQPSQPDDGWIEIEDPKGSQVNTGGRTIVEFRRDVEEKEVNGDGGTQTEKFSGWRKVTHDGPASTLRSSRHPADEKKEASVDAPSSAFPTLADAAKVKNLPSSTAKQSSTTSRVGIPSRRPRFINSQPDKLRQKLAERSASQSK